MTNPATPNLLSLIRKIPEERRSEDLRQLTDAELVAKLARALSNDNGDERLIACAVALWTAPMRAVKETVIWERHWHYCRKPAIPNFPWSNSPRCVNRRLFANCGILRHHTSCGESSLKILSRERAEFFERCRNLLIATGAAARGDADGCRDTHR